MPEDTVVPAHRSGSVQPSAQCIPQVGHTQSVWCRSTVHPHVTNRSDGRPGPLVVHRCPAGQPGGGTRTQPRGVRCHFDQSISRTIEQVYECGVIPPCPPVAFAQVSSECQWLVVQLFYARIG